MSLVNGIANVININGLDNEQWAEHESGEMVVMLMLNGGQVLCKDEHIYIWTSTINGFILCLCIEKNKTKQTRTSTYTQSECNVLIAIFECCCWSLLQALLIFLSSSLLSFRFQRGILYALATADARNARQTKMNLVLFQGECGNKNIVCTNWIFTCIVWFGRSERRIRKRQKKTPQRCVCSRYINSLFGQVDAIVFGNVVEYKKIGKISAQDIAEL